MLNKLNIGLTKQKLIVYIILTAVTLAVYWQVNQFDFIDLDDFVYVTENFHLKSGITLSGIRWAFVTTYAEFWHPLTWLSLMLDYQFYGLNAGGYHVTNLILHILSTLLLLWLFNRMTGSIWKSAFVAAVFALHPLHVESVAWVSERKDVLSAFFWMLTLCLYVYYTEKPVIKRYLLVLFSFVLALMSKPMVITLPVIMILLDYWPLGRLQKAMSSTVENCHKLTGRLFWEKTPFFVLSAVFSVITIYAQRNSSIKRTPYLLSSRIANAPVSFVTYLEKTFWPHDMAIFYHFPAQIPVWKVIGASLLILVITTFVIVMVKRLPYLFVGWFWYTITIAPVIGIIQVGQHAIADRYTYLPSIAIAVMLAWGISTLIKSRETRKYFSFPAGIIILTIMAVLAWHQCSYWKNSIKLFSHTLKVTKNNYMAHNNRGAAYVSLGQYQLAIDDFNRAIRINPDTDLPYHNRGAIYGKLLGQYQLAIDDFNRAIRINPYFIIAFNDRGVAYTRMGLYQKAIDDFNEAIRLKPDYANAFNNRAYAYLNYGDHVSCCRDAKKACALGNCKALEWAKGKGLCR